MTEQTPNTMPSAVRSERSLWSQRLLTPRRTVRLSRSNHGPRITPIDANELVEDSHIKQFFPSPRPRPPPPPPLGGGEGEGGCCFQLTWRHSRIPISNLTSLSTSPSPRRI